MVSSKSSEGKNNIKTSSLHDRTHQSQRARRNERKTSIYKNGKGTDGCLDEGECWGCVECVYVRRKKQNCPIDDEGLRFYYSENGKKQQNDCTPSQKAPASNEHQIVNFFLDVGGGNNIRSHASKTFSLGVER